MAGGRVGRSGGLGDWREIRNFDFLPVGFGTRERFELMRFWLLDAIESYTPGERLEGVKNVSYSEDYLEDHFPEFPVLPGVFMLEAATQAAAWLLRITDDFADSVIVLREAKNIKYANFVQPGQKLRVAVEQIKKEDRLATFKVAGSVDGKSTITGRIVLERYSLADDDPHQAETDERVRVYLRKILRSLMQPGSDAAG